MHSLRSFFWGVLYEVKSMFNILRHAKHKMSSLSAVFNHNVRTLNSEFDHGNVDHSSSWKNRYLDFYPGQTLQEKIHNRISKLDNSATPPKIRNSGSKNDSVVAVEMLLTASPEYFKHNSYSHLMDWYKTNVTALQARYGENLIHVALHLDESTPHIHAIYTPIIKKTTKNRKAKSNEEKDLYSWVFDAKTMTSRENLIDAQDYFYKKNMFLGLKRGVSAAKKKALGMPARHRSLKELRTQQQQEEILKTSEALERLSKGLVSANSDLGNVKREKDALTADLVAVREERDSILKQQEILRERLSKYFYLENGVTKLHDEFLPLAQSYLNSKLPEHLKTIEFDLTRRESRLSWREKMIEKEWDRTAIGKLEHENKNLKMKLSQAEYLVSQYKSVLNDHKIEFEIGSDNQNSPASMLFKK